jgi:hypothetical protein
MIRRILLTLALVAAPPLVLLLATYEIISVDVTSFMEDQPSIDYQAAPPAAGAVYPPFAPGLWRRGGDGQPCVCRRGLVAARRGAVLAALRRVSRPGRGGRRLAGRVLEHLSWRAVPGRVGPPPGQPDRGAHRRIPRRDHLPHHLPGFWRYAAPARELDRATTLGRGQPRA